MKNEKQQWAIYKNMLKKWQKSRPKDGNQYEIEQWLEEKPQEPGTLPS